QPQRNKAIDLNLSKGVMHSVMGRSLSLPCNFEFIVFRLVFDPELMLTLSNTPETPEKISRKIPGKISVKRGSSLRLNSTQKKSKFWWGIFENESN
ncbi:MAG TPA: hypothetical protein V6C65_27880, partial [Allocoleopsis sp.]